MMKRAKTPDVTAELNGVINVRERVAQQREWRRQHEIEEQALYARLDRLWPNLKDKKVRAEARRIAKKIQQIEWKKVAQPLDSIGNKQKNERTRIFPWHRQSS